MFSDGTYPGIEYRVMGLTDAKTGKALFTTRGCNAQEVLVTVLFFLFKVLMFGGAFYKLLAAGGNIAY